ncbi:acyltransferase [Arthrobacter sp. Sa2BUA2]|uniref:Acyltransferase n=1 Tax=Arthrobacter pullicola TaxID=2762224 RepID=A0ABR8YIZ6_9MICC|nr:acyltransferase family protein [Arthrobacter pullicola]MBD8044206.1 acyltransferase [Arthrobacter pullicola]
MSQEILATREQQAPPPKRASFRPEVQGLRALAVLMVVTYHVWFGRVSGGVDIFLLISAFLLTLSFVRKVEAGKALDLGRYWLHMFKRLLPAVVVVLLAVLTATALFVPRSRWSEILSQTWSSLFYFQNWALASNSVDYYAADQSVASPLQHFWSLSIQGQVFVLWPLLFGLAAFIARATGMRFRRIVMMIFGALFLGSLAFSIHETYTNQVHAYFDTRTRLWEFAFGTLLALALPYLKPHRWIRVGMGWLGVVIMLSVGFVLDVQGQFPGYVALVPLTAASLVIVAGQTESRVGADRLLSWKPLTRLGDISYALYLWHWPILVIYLIWRDREEVGPVGGTAIIGLSLVLAYLTTKLVERPMRSMSWATQSSARTGLVVAVCVAVVAAPVTAWQQGLKLEAERLTADANRNYPGAAVLVPGYEDQSDPDVGILPLVGDEWPDFGSSCLEKPSALESRCKIAGTTDFTLALVGSSHAKVWATPLISMAEERGWNLSAWMKGNCPLALETGTVAQDCVDFNEELVDEILRTHPDIVVTTSSRTVVGGNEYVDDTWNDVVKKFTEAGIKVAAIRDTPRFESFIPECVDRNPDNPSLCGIESEVVFNRVNPAEDSPPVHGLAHLDFTDMLCPGGFCEPVIGNVMVYLDTNHLTASYLRTMTDVFAERFDQAIHGLD